MIAALLLASIGLKAVFDSHNLAEPQMPNLYTLHSWIGLAAVIFFAMQVSFELTSFTYKVAVGSTSSASKLRSCTVAVGVRCVPVSRSAPFAALVLHAAARLWRPHDIRLGDRRSHQRTLGKGHFYKVQSQNKWIVDILWLAYLFVCFVHQVGLHSTGSHDGRYPHQLHRSVGSGFVGGHHLYRYPMAVQETATARGWASARRPVGRMRRSGGGEKEIVAPTCPDCFNLFWHFPCVACSLSKTPPSQVCWTTRLLSVCFAFLFRQPNHFANWFQSVL